MRRAAAATAVAAVVLALLAAGAPAAAQAISPAAPAAPVRHRVGLYVTDLYGFDLPGGSFGATFWVWATGPDAERTLARMEFANADALAFRLDSTAARGPVQWSQRKAVGRFRERWDLRRFPFDRHVLEIQLEEGVADEPAALYEADTAQSGYGGPTRLEGWRVAGMRVAVGTARYATAFGDPAESGGTSRYSRLTATLELARADYTGFLKLTAPLYAGFLLCAIGCLVPITPLTFGTRATLLVASLFALVVNMRAASAALGSEHGASLLDGLHIAGLAYLVAVMGLSVAVRVRLDRAGGDAPAPPDPLDRPACLAAAGLFVAANAALLALAAGSVAAR